MKTKHEQLRGEITLNKETFCLLRAWEGFLIDRLGDESPFIHAPLLIAKEELEKVGYIKHFPQNALKAVSEIEKSVISNRYLTPASCLHVYPEYSDTEIKESIRHTVLGRCARHEAGKYKEPYRLSSFHMLEFVTIGTPANTALIRDKEEQRMLEIFSELGIEGSLITANDPFFAGEDEGAYLLQKIKGLKHEFVVSDNGVEVSLASINAHEQHFTQAYNIRSQGDIATSLCVAFGLERIVMYSMSLWGPEKANWPQPLKDYA